MARDRKRDARFDLRGGVNTAFAEDLLDGGELRMASNARSDNGIIAMRCGSRRLHTSALPNKVQGMVMWTPTGAAQRQLVVIADGGLYYKNEGVGTFTLVGAGTFNNSDIARFAFTRNGGALVIFIACGNALQFWTGAALTAIVGGPTDAVDVAFYKGRVYAITRDSKTLYASVVSAPTNWSTGAGALQEDVETFDGESLVGLCVCGSSLILAKEDSIVRLTGVATSDIRIDRNTDGISSDVGCIARGTLIPLERGFFFVSDRGPYLGTESSVEAVGLKVAAEFDFANKALWSKAVATHHKGRHEVWLSSADVPNGTANNRLWAFDYINRKWDGPWAIAAYSLAPMERSNGRETVMRGSTAGWVTEEDIPNVYRDDCARDGTGGNAIAMQVVYPQLMFGDPGREKNMRGMQQIQANLEPGTSLIIDWFSEMGSGTLQVQSKGFGMRNYPFRPGAKGKRITFSFTAVGGYAEIGGAVWDAALGRARRGTATSSTTNIQSGVPNTLYVIPLNFSLAAGEVVQLQCIGLGLGGVEVPVGAVQWSSDLPGRATVSSTGVVSRVSAGAVTITATVDTISGVAFGTML